MIYVYRPATPARRTVPLNGLGVFDGIEMLQSFAIGLGVFILGRTILGAFNKK